MKVPTGKPKKQRSIHGQSDVGNMQKSDDGCRVREYIFIGFFHGVPFGMILIALLKSTTVELIQNSRIMRAIMQNNMVRGTQNPAIVGKTYGLKL